MKENKTYSNRFVAFVDILGFKNLVNNSNSNQKLIETIDNVLSEIEDDKNRNSDKALGNKAIGREITNFSDSIVISYSTECQGAGVNLLIDVRLLQLRLLYYGILSRGAVTFGKLIHDDDVCFGPALVEAYKMEEHDAIYPRVIVDESVIKEDLHNPYLNVDNDQEEFADILRVDQRDGYRFINYIVDDFDYPSEFEQCKIKIQQIIDNIISNREAEFEIVRKYVWLAHFYHYVTHEKLDDDIVKKIKCFDRKKNIRLLVMDVDGTLTDGGIYIGKYGELFKRFDVKDGYAISKTLKKAGIISVILTGRKSIYVKNRCRELGIKYVIQGSKNKMQDLSKLMERLHIEWNQVAVIGDDLTDMPVIKKALISACPADAVTEVKKYCDYVADRKGGHGAVREITDWIVRGN